MIPKTLPVGSGFITITTEDFFNGFQVGHLAYLLNRCTVPSTDEHLTEQFLAKLECMDCSSLYSMGYTIGWLAILANKGVQSC